MTDVAVGVKVRVGVRVFVVVGVAVKVLVKVGVAVFVGVRVGVDVIVGVGVGFIYFKVKVPIQLSSHADTNIHNPLSRT